MVVDLGFGVQASEFMVQEPGLRVQGSGFRGQGFLVRGHFPAWLVTCLGESFAGLHKPLAGLQGYLAHKKLPPPPRTIISP